MWWILIFLLQGRGIFLTLKRGVHAGGSDSWRQTKRTPATWLFGFFGYPSRLFEVSDRQQRQEAEGRPPLWSECPTWGQRLTGPTRMNCTGLGNKVGQGIWSHRAPVACIPDTLEFWYCTGTSASDLSSPVDKANDLILWQQFLGLRERLGGTPWQGGLRPLVGYSRMATSAMDCKIIRESFHLSRGSA